MKKCKCGKEIDDKWDLCYECNQKARETQGMSRDESIQRQTTAKATSAILAGRITNEAEYTAWFNHILKLIRGA